MIFPGKRARHTTQDRVTVVVGTGRSVVNYAGLTPWA